MQTNTSPLLLLQQASTKVGAKIIGPFDLNIQQGEHIAVLGPSGAGKSTLLKLITKELPLHSGHYTLNDQAIQSWSLADLSKIRAVLPQSHDIAFGLTVDVVISLGRITRMHHDPLLHSIVEQAATLACCQHLLKQRFDTLSGGEKARVQLARVFAQLWDVKNGLLLVDEPIAALDPGLQFDLMDAITTFVTERHHTVIAVLHDINHAINNFKRFILIKDSQLMGDLQHDISMISHLEKLYNIQFDILTNQGGELFIKPVRQRKR